MAVVGALAVGLAMTGQVYASAAPVDAAVTVTPSTDLNDGDTVTVSVTGFAANETVITIECAEPTTGVVVCNLPDAHQVIADANGSASTDMVVRRAFAGSTLDGKEWGQIDCDTVAGGCGISGVNAGLTTIVKAPVSFR